VWLGAFKQDQEMIETKFAQWVNLSVKTLHNRQVEHEKQNSGRFKEPIAPHMAKLLQCEEMKGTWRSLLLGLKKQRRIRATHDQVYTLLAGAILTAQKEQTSRLALCRKEKDELITDTMGALRTLQINLRKIGNEKLSESLPENEIRSALDYFDRLGELGNPNNKNTERDLYTYFIEKCFMSVFPSSHKAPNGKVRLVRMKEVSFIVSVLFDLQHEDEGVTARAATKAYHKIDKAFSLKSAVWAMERFPQYDI